MRLVKIPAIGDGDFDMVRVQKAERLFLESLKTEAKRPVQPRRGGRAAQGSGRASTAAGRGLGRAYAALNSGNMRARDLDRLETFAGAIKRGVDEAQRRDEIDAELMRDPEHLRSLGFHGVSEDD
jgi:hypothetical protein